MKPSRIAAQNSSQAQAECGVWLDTVQMKGKAKKKQLRRPISKLLNPFTDGEGYNVAVALNFTQTKIEMPKTKQSSISNFFTREHRVLKKMSTSEGPTTDGQEPCLLSTLTSPESVASGARTVHKEDRELCTSDNQPHWSDVDYKPGEQNISEPGDVMWWEIDKESHGSFPNTHNDYKEERCEDMSPSRTKRRISGATLSTVFCNSSQGLLMHNHQDSESQPFSQKRTLSDTEPTFLHSLYTEKAFGRLINAEGRTSTQKPSKDFQVSQMDKENTTQFKSPKKPLPLSHIQPLLNHSKLGSPKKPIPNEMWRKADESFNSQFKCTKPKSSWMPLRDSDEDSMAMLFTQDSEGFSVIAHRGLQARSPLKDQSNVSTMSPSRSCDVKCLEEDEDMLFTQDSQGNVVIKH